MNLSLNPKTHNHLLGFNFMQVIKEICQELNNEDKDTNSLSYILTFVSQMLRMNDIGENIEKLFKQGIVDIIVFILGKANTFMLHEITECLNIIIATT